MKKNLFRNHAVQESILFLLMGGSLLWYALDSYNSSFNKDWSQSPYLFPVIVAVLLLVLALCLFRQGLKAVPAPADAPKEKPNTQPVRTLVVALLSIAYYAALSYISLPVLSFQVFSLTIRFSAFELSTLIFLLAMMLYLGERKPVILGGVSIGATLFLSIAFRSLLHVLLP